MPTPADTPRAPTAPLDAAALAAVYAVAPIGVTITRAGITEFCNRAYLALFGYEGHEAEIYGKSLLVMVAPEEREALIARIRARQAGAVADAAYDLRGLRRDGSTFPFHCVVRGVELADGPATLAFFLDLTTQKRVEEDLRQSNELLAALFEACPVPTMLLDVEGRVQLWNPAAVSAFGWTKEESIGRRNPLVAEEHRGEYDANVAAALREGLRGREARRRRKDGAPVDLEIYAAPVRDASGGAVGTVALTMDVTERKQTEEALRRSEEQLRHAQKMEAVGRLAGGVAHDFNNVLTVIAGIGELFARAGEGDKDLDEAVAELRRAVGRAKALTRQLLAFSRRQVLAVEVVDPGAVVRGMEPMLRALTGSDVELVIDVDGVAGHARADAGQLEQVIVNLAVNARDAMPNGGRLSVTTSRVTLGRELETARFAVPGGEYVRVRVEDTGTGMDETVLARLFEPFFTTKERGKGTGLGLSTAFGIVRQSGGYLHVTTRVGEGSTFDVYLPRIDGPEPRVSVAADAPPPTVVLAEDDDDLRRLVRDMLLRQGIAVHEARDAEEALARLRETDPRRRVLLTDVLMPGTTGPELAALAFAEDPELPVVFMSGYAEPGTFPPGVRERAAGFLPKPFDEDALVRKVLAAAGRRRAASP